VTEGIKTISGFAIALPIYGLSIFFSVKITGIENGAYGKSAKAAVLAFIPVIIFIFLILIGTTYFHPLAASILATFTLPFVFKRVFQTTYVSACLASVIVLCLQIVSNFPSFPQFNFHPSDRLNIALGE